MAITYTWSINPIEYEDKGELSQVATVLHWQLSGEENGVEAQAIGTYALGDPNPSSFTDWPNLTLEVVLGWMPVEYRAQQEAAVAAQIDAKQAEAAKNKGKGVPW